MFVATTKTEKLNSVGVTWKRSRKGGQDFHIRKNRTCHSYGVFISFLLISYKHAIPTGLSRSQALIISFPGAAWECQALLIKHHCKKRGSASRERNNYTVLSPPTWKIMDRLKNYRLKKTNKIPKITATCPTQKINIHLISSALSALVFAARREISSTNRLSNFSSTSSRIS